MTRTNHSRSAFTLIELLVVISIIGILASLLLPVLSNAKKKTNRIVCINNIRQVGSALLSFSMDNNDLFPWQLGPFDQKMHFGSMDPFSVQTIVSTTAMKNELGTPKILMSPCDPEAQNSNEQAQANWNNYDTYKGKIIPCDAISYSFGKGATPGRPGTLLGITRNLSSLDLKTTRLIGADEPKVDKNAFSGLNKSQGQAVLADGSAKQIDDNRIHQITKYHNESSGGTFAGPASTEIIGCCAKKPTTCKPKKPIVPVTCGGNGGYLTLIAVQAGSTVAIDNLRITCLSSGKVWYENNFNDGNLEGLDLQHSHNARHNQIVNGQLILKAAGHYEAYGRMHLKRELPENYELSFIVNKLQWAGHFEFVIFSDPSKRMVPIAKSGIKFATNINGSKINHVTTWTKTPETKVKKNSLYGFYPGWSGKYQGKPVQYKLQMRKDKLTLWVQGQKIASN